MSKLKFAALGALLAAGLLSAGASSNAQQIESGGFSFADGTSEFFDLVGDDTFAITFSPNNFAGASGSGDFVPPFGAPGPYDVTDVQVSFTCVGTCSTGDGASGIYEASNVAGFDFFVDGDLGGAKLCLLYTSPSPRDATLSRMPSSA